MSAWPPDGHELRIGRPEFAPSLATAAALADGRDQRDALRRRHARAPHHLHGDGAAPDGRRPGRPAAGAGESLGTDTEPLNVTVAADGLIFLQEEEVTEDQLFTTIQALLANDPEKRIILSGSKDADYGMVAVVLARLREAGSRHVALQTRALDGSAGESDS